MKRLTIITLVAGQVAAAAAPATAAEIGDRPGSGHGRFGAFAGAGLRVPLGGGGEKAQAGLALAPMHLSGSTGTARFARGAELDFSTGEKVNMKLGGRPIAELTQGSAPPNGRRMGATTGEGLLIVGGIVALTLAGLALLLMSQE